MKIMFICTGNICRSAMAHGLLEKRLEENKIENVKVYSCGIYAEDGDGASYNAIEAMKDYDVDLRSHRATSIRNSAIQDMDLILCMTRSHKHSVLALYPELQGKVFTLKEYVKYQDSSQNIDISDPWGYDLETYRRCAEELDICISLLIEKIKNNIDK